MSHTVYPPHAHAAGYMNSNTSYEPLAANTPSLPQQEYRAPSTRHALAGFIDRNRRRKPKDVAHELDQRIENLPAYKRMKAMRQRSRAVSTVTSSFMFAAMVAVTIIFVNTESELINGRPIWPRQPVEWPTYLLLAGALISLLSAVITLIFFYIAYERASKSWKLVLALQSIEVGYWIVVAVVYRKEKQLSDLWGWSCSNVANLLQKDGGSVHFDKLCTLQTVSWWVSIAETILKVVALAWCLVLLRKLKKETAHMKMKITELVGGQISDGIQNFLI
jgi:hypothetical protein